jgi:cyanophycinase
MAPQGSLLALVGGAEWQPRAAPLDAWLLERSGSRLVTVLPTAAREHPELAVATARRHFASLGGEVEAAMVLTRADAEQPAWRARLGSSAFLYLAGGDPSHLASVLAGTPAWQGVLDALGSGRVVAGSSAGAMMFCDRMLRPGATATEPGLGVLRHTVVLPHHERWHERLGEVGAVLSGSGPPELQVLGVDECTGLVLEADPGASPDRSREPSGGPGAAMGAAGCRVLGAGSVTRYRLAPGGLTVDWVRRAPAQVDGCLPGAR